MTTRRTRMALGGGMLALFVAALAIFLLPFAFPTPPPIVTRFQATRLMSPNGDGRRDTARVSVRMREPGTVTLVVVRDGKTVRTLMRDQAVPRGWVRAAWGGRDDAGLPVRDGIYAIDLRANVGQKRFWTSRRIVLDLEGPGIAQAEVRSALDPRVRAPAQCALTVVLAGEGRVSVALTARPDGGEPETPLMHRALGDATPQHWSWDGRRDGTATPAGLVGLRIRATDPARNESVVQRTCWVGPTRGEVRPARPAAGDRVRVHLRDARGHALPASTPLTLRLYRRIGTPGRATRVLGGRVALPVRTTAGAATMLLPRTITPGALWLLAQSPHGGLALVDLAAGG